MSSRHCNHLFTWDRNMSPESALASLLQLPGSRLHCPSCILCLKSLPSCPTALPPSLPASVAAVASYRIALPLILPSQAYQTWSSYDRLDHGCLKPSSGSPTLQKNKKIKTPHHGWDTPSPILGIPPGARGRASASLIAIQFPILHLVNSASIFKPHSEFTSPPPAQRLLWPSLWVSGELIASVITFYVLVLQEFARGRAPSLIYLCVFRIVILKL